MDNAAGQYVDQPTLILVEDIADVRKVFSLVLSTLGFRVVEFGCLPEAQKFCKNSLPDAALIDIELGGQDGLALGTFIRQLSGGDRVVLATLTGDDSGACRERSREFGFNLHFVKPVCMNDVGQKLHSLLQAM